jgi:hypothetical protein
VFNQSERQILNQAILKHSRIMMKSVDLMFTEGDHQYIEKSQIDIPETILSKVSYNLLTQYNQKKKWFKFPRSPMSIKKYKMQKVKQALLLTLRSNFLEQNPKGYQVIDWPELHYIIKLDFLHEIGSRESKEVINIETDWAKINKEIDSIRGKVFNGFFNESASNPDELLEIARATPYIKTPKVNSRTNIRDQVVKHVYFRDLKFVRDFYLLRRAKFRVLSRHNIKNIRSRISIGRAKGIILDLSPLRVTYQELARRFHFIPVSEKRNYIKAVTYIRNNW